MKKVITFEVDIPDDLLKASDEDVQDCFDYAINDAVNQVFYEMQNQVGIESGDEPLDSNIHSMEISLAEECRRIFHWQCKYCVPDEVKQDSIIRYQYNGGGCFFIIDDIKVDVFDLRDMRNNTYVDVCVLSINYTDDNGICMHHIIPDVWLYGSTSDEFDDGQPVHEQFINAASEYIKKHNIIKEA